MNANTSEPLRPLFFIVRPGDQRMVPLIAVDELPAFVTIQGAPKTLTVNEITGMVSVGTYEVRDKQHVVEGVYANKPPSHERSCILVAHEKQAASTISEGTTLSCSATLTSNTPAINTAPGVKVYCDHWIATGACSFVQKGCHYKHEMPLTAEGLAAIGQPDIPAWYRRKYGVASLHLAPGMTTPSYSINDSRAHQSNNWWNPANQGARENNTGAYGGHQFGARGARGKGRQANKPMRSTAEEDAIQARREAAAKALDLQEEKRRQAMQNKYKSLSPDRDSVFKHDPNFDSGFDSEAECSSLMSDQDRYEVMSDAAFEAEQLERVRRVHASRSAAAAAAASASAASASDSSALSVLPGRAQGRQGGGKNGNRRNARGGKKHSKQAGVNGNGYGNGYVNGNGHGNRSGGDGANGKQYVKHMKKCVADKAVVRI